MTEPAAVVIGLDTIVGLQTARVLAKRGVPVIGIADDTRHYCARTRSVGRLLGAPTAGEGLIDCLIGLIGASEHPPVLFPCRDPSVRTVSEHRDRLRPAHILLPDHAVIESLADKTRFGEHARALGLRLPSTWTVDDGHSLEAAAADTRYPAILKPSFRDDRWQDSGSAKGFVVDDPEALRKAHATASAVAERFVVQEWIPGPRTAQYTCNALFGADGEVRGTFVSRKVRQWPLDTGVGSMGVGVVDSEIEDITIRLFRSVGFRGLAYLEVKRDPRDGTPVIIEPNVGRPTGRGALADHSGVELLYGMYREAIGRPLDEIGVQGATPKTWVHLRADLQAGFSEYRRGETTLRRWFGSYRPPLVDAVCSWSDPAPMVADLIRSFRVALRPLTMRFSRSRP